MARVDTLFLWSQNKATMVGGVRCYLTLEQTLSYQINFGFPRLLYKTHGLKWSREILLWIQSSEQNAYNKE